MDPWDLLEPFDLLSKLPANFNTELESKKWQERKDALDNLLKLLKDNPRLTTKTQYSELIDTLRRVIEKDSHIQVVATATRCMTGVANGIKVKFGPYASALVPIVLDKFKEKKSTLREPMIECIDAIYATTILEPLAEDVLAALAKPNPQIRIQTNAFLYRVFKRLKAANAPKKFLKDVAPVLVKLTSDPDPEVRDSACMALGGLSKCIGQKAAGIFMGELSNDKVKMGKVEEFCAKATAEAAEEEAAAAVEGGEDVSAASTNGGSSKQKTATATATAPSAPTSQPEIDPWDVLDPVDILPKLPDNFKTELESKKWTERKAVLDTLYEQLQANPRLDTKAHYSDLVETLKRVLDKDSHIQVAAIAAKCITGLANGLRLKFGVHAQSLTAVVFDKCKEKKQALRDPLIECIDAIYATTTLEQLADDILAAIGKQNPSIKIQTNLFLYRVFKQAKAAAVPKKFLKELIPALIKQTCDPDPEVRDASCSALGSIMKCIGQKPAMVLMADVVSDKAKFAKIEEFYAKALAEAPPEVVSAMVQSIHKPDAAPVKVVVAKRPAPAAVVVAVKSEEEEEEDGDEEPLKPPAKSLNTSDEAETAATAANKAKRDRSSSQFKKKQTAAAADETAAAAPESLLRADSDRNARAKEERTLKLLKWNFDAPTDEHTQQLNSLLTDFSKPPLTPQLLSKDFKQHLKALEYLQELLIADPLPIIANVDLILKWATIRFFDTNPAVLIKLLDFICLMFSQMDSQSEMLSDSEMTNFLPYLLLKSGDTKDVIRNNVRRIVRLLGSISIPGKVFPLLLNGMSTKNSRQKTECIIIADSFLDVMGVNITATPQVTLKALAGSISDRDSSVRNAALNAIVTVYRKIGDRVFSLIGQLNEKERAMLDERIKRSGKFVGQPASELSSEYNRPATMQHQQQSSGARLNSTISNATPVRARSSSTNRRSMAAMPSGSDAEYTMGGGGGSTNTAPSSSRKSMGALPNSNSKFQLDPKFFSNDLGDINIRAVDTVGVTLADLNPIQPVVRASGAFTRRSESVSSISSLENAEQIDRTVHQLSSLTLSTADEAIAQLLHLFHDPINRQYIVDRTELILKTFVTQIFHIRSQHLEQLPSSASSDTTIEPQQQHSQQESELSEFMRSVCNFLSSLVKDDAIVQKIGADTMRAFIDAILALVSDDRLTNVAGSRQIFRSLNVVVIRLCEFSNPNNCFISLMKLLVKYQQSEPEGRIIALIRKCLFKHVDVFLDPAKYEQLDLQIVFDLLHSYYSKFYVDPVAESVKETCRTLNVYIQRLVVTKRYKVLNFLYPYPENSHLVNYVRRCVRALGKSDAAKAANAATTTSESSSAAAAEGGGAGDTTTATPNNYNVVPDELVELFRRIANDIFDGCVEEVYNYMDISPEQNGNFERLMATCEYSCIVRRAFSEIRRCRLKKEPSKQGDCVRAVLPEEDKDFLERQLLIQQNISNTLKAFNQMSK